MRGPARAGVRLGAMVLVVSLAACSRRREPFRIATPDPATRRSTPSGELIGGLGRYGSHAWLGIPYARPPVGDLRWRAPLPLEPWSGMREATAHGAPCTQYASAFGGIGDASPGTPVGQEDCLTLDVYAPRFEPASVPQGAGRLPVMVWIHGGGNTIGSAAFYEGGNLATTHDLVVVVVQYRLGPFGWFRHPALAASAASDEDASGNFGTLDLVRALEWVRDNIAAFGGDPGNVTIFGESAGGQNVYTLLVAKQARGLFQRAIAESGGLAFSTPAEAENLADATQAGAGQSSGEILLRLLERDAGAPASADNRSGAAARAAAQARARAMSAAETASYLRGKSARDVLTAYAPSAGSGMIDMPRTFGEGTVLPADPLARLSSADGYAHVPFIAGTNKDENKLFMITDPSLIRRRFWIFLRFVDEPSYLETAGYLARMWKATGADEPVSRMRAAQGPSVYVYRFDWDEEPTILGADLAKMLGAAHAMEIPFVFGHFDLGPRLEMIFTAQNAPGRQALSQAMMSYWAEFARSGAPGRGRHNDLPEWTAWDSSRPDAPKTLVLDTPADGGIRMAAIEETRESVIASVDKDPRLTTAKDRCRILRALAERSRGFSRAQYAQLAACSAYPYDRFP
ncbi:MAG TPA: carboxylesterase family protein [Candidatus Bathyarchaeia archaeon]|nr:carboxylesterase family protein [Candidatus Bathyarchaeia archaeon]